MCVYLDLYIHVYFMSIVSYLANNRKNDKDRELSVVYEPHFFSVLRKKMFKPSRIRSTS